MKTEIFSPAEQQVIRYHSRRRAARQILATAALAVLAAFIALHTALLAAAKHSQADLPPPAVAANTVSDGQAEIPSAIPADWTENPLAAVVYEPVSE